MKIVFSVLAASLLLAAQPARGCGVLTLEQQIAAAAQHYGVSPQLAVEVARRESSLNPAAIGAAGEVGLFQLMPSTAADLGVNPWSIPDNIAGGVRYLRQMFDRFGDWNTALVAYNAGPGNVERGTAPARSYGYARGILGKAVPGAGDRPVFSTTVWGAPQGPAESFSLLPAGVSLPEGSGLVYAALALAGIAVIWMVAR